MSDLPRDRFFQQRSRIRYITVRRAHCKLCDYDIPLIRTLIASAVPFKYIAAYYGVTKGVISDINCGRTWKHVSDDLETHLDRFYFNCPSPKSGDS